MTLRRIFCVGLLVLCAACGGGAPEPPTTGEAKDFASVCDKANEGKRVAVVGFLRFPEKFTGTSSVVLRLYGGSDYTGAPIGVQTKSLLIGESAAPLTGVNRVTRHAPLRPPLKIVNMGRWKRGTGMGSSGVDAAYSVMPGLDPAIHVFLGTKAVARHQPGQDVER